MLGVETRGPDPSLHDLSHSGVAKIPAAASEVAGVGGGTVRHGCTQDGVGSGVWVTSVALS